MVVAEFRGAEFEEDNDFEYGALFPLSDEFNEVEDIHTKIAYRAMDDVTLWLGFETSTEYLAKLAKQRRNIFRRVE